jgi:hypothetical protein
MQTAEQTAQGQAGTAAPALAGPTFTIVGPDGKPITLIAPTTIEQMQALQARREALADQLSSAADRRAQIASEIATTEAGPARTGLEERLKVLDQRIVQLETDLSTTGQQLANAPGDLARVAQIAQHPQGGGDDFEEGVVAGGFGVSFAWVAVLGFRWWRRKRRGPKPAKKMADDSTQRLERLEQGMDAIAIEIERVSEGQRFVTKLLSEASPLNGRQIAPVEERVEANR